MRVRAVVGPALAVEPDRAAVFGSARAAASRWRGSVGYLCGALAAATSTEIGFLARNELQLADVIMIYLVGVVVIATRFDITVSVFAAVAAVLTFDFVFVPPEFTLSLPDVRSAITCAGMLGVAVVISALTTRARRFEASSRLREARTALLYELSRELVEAANFEEVVAVAVRHLEALLGRRVAVLAPGSDGTFAAVDAFGPIWLTQAELGRAADVFRAGVERGASSSGEHARGDTRELGTYFSLLTGSGSPFGLVAVRGARNLFADATEREFFEACAHQAALALERADLAQKAAAAERAAEREQVRNALLRSISHDFRTPLAAILGAGLSLKDYGSALEPAARSMLEGTIVEQGQRLHRLLTNVLSATRLDGGELELEKSPCSIDEIVESALRHLGEAVGRRHVDVSLPFELPLVDADAVLLEQLVVNVVENALRYAGAETPIEIAARARDGNVELTIADHGRGVAPGDEARLFEKFYRGASSKPNDGGMGLGLTICRAVAEAHGGSIVAANREGGGFCVTTTLPCAFAGSCDAAFELSLPEGVA